MRRNENVGIEWPTLGLLVVCYATWAFATTVLADWSLPVAMLVTALSITLHSSLQHENLHGHPFRSAAINEALVFLPLGLIYPFRRFRDLHLAHHRDETLTDPYDDPETNFYDPAVWRQFPAPLRALLQVNNTLAGRMLFGPLIGTATFIAGEVRELRKGNRTLPVSWALHLAGLALVMVWIYTAAMPGWAYVVSAYGGLSVLKIRTYLEHRVHDRARGRSVIIERQGFLSFMFLNNSFHAVHHSKPGAAWYRLPALYRAQREEYLRRNDGYTYASYGEVFRRYFLRAKDPVPHPLWPQD